MFAFTNGFVTLTLIHIRKHNLTRIIFVWLNYEPIAEAIERAASPLAHTLRVDEAEASQTFHAGTGINLMPTQSIKEKLRTQIEELTEVSNSAHETRRLDQSSRWGRTRRFWHALTHALSLFSYACSASPAR